MSESICIAATLGAYPAVSQPRCGSGPTNFNALDQWYDFFTCLHVVFCPYVTYSSDNCTKLQTRISATTEKEPQVNTPHLNDVVWNSCAVC